VKGVWAGKETKDFAFLAGKKGEEGGIGHEVGGDGLRKKKGGGGGGGEFIRGGLFFVERGSIEEEEGKIGRGGWRKSTGQIQEKSWNIRIKGKGRKGGERENALVGCGVKLDRKKRRETA